MTDAQWARIEPLLPERTPKRGGRWRDHRQVIDAIAFKYRTSTPWMDLPEHFGSWKGAHNRLRRWAADGTWSKVHLAADGRCRPPAFVITPGQQAGDAPAFEQVMALLRVPRRVGRPRVTPEAVPADKAYSSRVIRRHLRRRGIRAVIPQPADQAANRKRLGSRGGRPPAFDRQAYKQRNTVARCINKLKQWRGLATRSGRRGDPKETA
ncbi:transposase [Streptomyces virginiae]|uniref:transposase n=1 Tax=Streptomyces virginiae TaxID=1961 RepID=UPI003640B256